MKKEEEKKGLVDRKKLKRQQVIICLQSIDEEFIEVLTIEQVFSLLVLLIGRTERINEQMLSRRSKEDRAKLLGLFKQLSTVAEAPGNVEDN